MKPVNLVYEGELAIITIDNPPLNLTETSVTNALDNALDEVEKSSARAVLLNAAGDHFGCGVNIKTSFVGVDSTAARTMLGKGVEIMQRMEQLPIPIICAVQGYCFAAALEIALRCDLIVAAKSAQFAQVEQAIGATTYLGGAYLLAERCGPVRAREICYTGDFYSSETFAEWNIINKVVPDADLQQEAKSLALRVAKGPTKAHGVTKQLIRHYLDQGIRAADDHLLDLGAPIFDSRDFKAGVDSIMTHGSRNFRDLVEFDGN